MKRVYSLVAILWLLNFSLGYAFSHPLKNYRRVIANHKTKVAASFRYLVKIETIRNRLKQNIPDYEFGSFYGAQQQDTFWAKEVTHDSSLMSEIYAENRLNMDSRQPETHVAFQLAEGRIVFNQPPSHLHRYKADPQQSSVVQIAVTSSGSKIAASTALTKEGLAVQTKTGCIGCHGS